WMLWFQRTPGPFVIRLSFPCSAATAIDRPDVSPDPARRTPRQRAARLQRERTRRSTRSGSRRPVRLTLREYTPREQRTAARRRSPRRRPTRNGAASGVVGSVARDDLEHGLAVGVALLLADAGDSGKAPHRGRSRLGERPQGGIAEHDVR